MLCMVQHWPSAFVSPSHSWGAVRGPKTYDKTPQQNTDSRSMGQRQAGSITSGCGGQDKSSWPCVDACNIESSSTVCACLSPLLVCVFGESKRVPCLLAMTLDDAALCCRAAWTPSARLTDWTHSA